MRIDELQKQRKRKRKAVPPLHFLLSFPPLSPLPLPLPFALAFAYKFTQTAGQCAAMQSSCTKLNLLQVAAA